MLDEKNNQENNTIENAGTIGNTQDVQVLKKKKTTILSVLFLCVIACSFFAYHLVSAPVDFPTYTVLNIRPGETLRESAATLFNTKLVRYPYLFQMFVITFGGERSIVAGNYFFAEKENSFRIAWRIAHGIFNIKEVKVTIPEGFTNDAIANLLEQKLVLFDKQAFIVDAKNDEGYLFPDTYFFPPVSSSTDIIGRMKGNFDQKIAPLETDIAEFKKTSLGKGYMRRDMIIMASIIEAEATSTTDRAIVSGILWRRLKLGLPLQVDATLKYVTGRGTAEITVEDLKSLSPYNTYTHKGLPPTPISNPGIESIGAAVHPVVTQYLYFLTGKNGGMYYAKTFEEHVKNKQRYL